MIYHLRKRFIGSCILSFIAVFLVLIALIFIITAWQTNQILDRHVDMISQNDGLFPNFNEPRPDGNRHAPPDGFNKESPFTTRYFTVRYNEAGEVIHADIRQVSGVTEAEAEAYAARAAEKNNTRGWCDEYRYKIYDTDSGTAVVFVSGVSTRESNRNFLLGTVAVFAMCSLVIIVLIIFISKRAVKPAAQSYEKQKQFITNAGHELKTPLTLIRANLDILESETGESEWLSDVREETMVMNELITRMVSLARMDEDGAKLPAEEFCLSDAVFDTVSAFISAIQRNGKQLSHNIDSHIVYVGDEAGIREVVSILMDNALKYCDAGGEITVSLVGGRHPVLTVENQYAAVEGVDLPRLFDRFYRADKARTYGSGFGIGLSMASAIVDKHRGSISAYRAGDDKIGFKVKL